LGNRWPPAEVKPNEYLNRGVRSIFFALKPNSSTSFPIDQLTHVLQTEREKTLIKIEFDQERITAALRNTPQLTKRVSVNSHFNMGCIDEDQTNCVISPAQYLK
jgi:hypothetical protein